MTIIDKPGVLELSGNLTNFLISSNTQVSFILKKGTAILLAQTYDPGSSGQIEIDVHDIIEANLSYIINDSESVYDQTNIVANFTAIIDTETVTFTVIRAGVENFSDSATNFLTANFLTWQPQVKKVTYYSPEFLTYYAVNDCIVKIEAHYSDSSTETITLGSLTAGKAYTIPLQYAIINSLLTTKLPGYYDVYICSVAGDRYTYIQRFVASNKLSEDEEWILFENSLGGLDTIRAYGEDDFTEENTHNLAEIDGVAEEYRIDTVRKHKKNTGYLDNYERQWLLDFFPSKRKYIYENSVIRQIVVIESDVSYTSKTLPSAYNFTYKYAASKPLLNLIRNETLSSEVIFSAPDVGSFILPPRLVEFPTITPTGGALIPVQSPYSETLGKITLAALAAYIKDDESFADIISAISDFAGKYLSKTDPDTAQNIITFTKGIKAGSFVSGSSGAQIDGNGDAEFRTALLRELSTFLKGIKTGNYAAGVSGGKIDENGNAEFSSVTIRQSLEAPELRYNRVKINVGDSWNAPGGGLIKSVDTINKIITLKLEDGEIGAIAVDDICMGIFHNTTGNASSDFDDSKGNRSFAGFSTCYFRVTEIIDTAKNSQFYYELRPISDNFPLQANPSASMTFVSYGNFTDSTRQTSRYTTRTYERYLKNMAGWEISVSNIAAQFGDLSNLSVHGLSMTGYSAYLNNIYMSGTIQQFVLSEPLRMEIDSSMGNMLGAGEETVVSCKVYKGWAKLTSYMTSWAWTRDSGNAADDTVWNNAHTGLTTQATITFDDLGDTVNAHSSCIFTITATYIENNIPETISQTLAI